MKNKNKLLQISLLEILLLTGCSSNGIEKKVEQQSMSISECNDEMYNYPGEKIYQLDKSLIENDKNLPYYTQTCTVREFGQYTNESNITWEDIKKTINQINIDEHIKKILLEGITNIQNHNLNINLELLNYNLKGLSIDYCDNISENAQFDCITRTVKINKNRVNDDNFKRIIIHEILGHGLTMGYIKENGGVLCVPSKIYFHLKNQNQDLHKSYFSFANTIMEAEAEMITVLATNTRISNDSSQYYDIFVDELQLILATTNTKLSDLINNGIDFLVAKMKEMGCDYPINYIIKYDTKKWYYESDMDFCKNVGYITDYKIEYLIQISDKMKQTGYDESYIIEFIDTCIDSSENYIVMDNNGISWQNSTTYEFVNFDEIKQEVSQRINQKSKAK